jgi:hypothetical protein
MTITIELTAEEEARLKAKAERAGLNPAELLRQFISADDKAQTDPRTDPNYRDSWTEEDMRDFTAATMHRLDQELGDEGDYKIA